MRQARAIDATCITVIRWSRCEENKVRKGPAPIKDEIEKYCAN